VAKPEIVPMFAVPFAFCQYEGAAALNVKLRQLALEHEAAGQHNPRPLTQRNAALFESHFDLFRHPSPAIQELKQFCWDQMLAVIGQLNGYTLPTLERLEIFNDAWVHVTRRGGYFSLHNHPNASWSGVYCVDTGVSDADRPDSGLLSFLGPSTASAMHFDAGNARIPPPYGTQMRNLRLEAGRLVLFPSWVLHEVKPFEGTGERITIAFNCWFNLPDAPTR
jgi:uncharacterized protein (TIGR02466 family)